MTDEQQQQEVEVFPTVVEWSSDGALMVELDWQGEGLRVQTRAGGHPLVDLRGPGGPDYAAPPAGVDAGARRATHARH